MEAEHEKKRFFKQAGIGSATRCLFRPSLTPDRTRLGAFTADSHGELGNTFSVLLSGLYKPVVDCPDLGLVQVNPL